ncbi:MAG: hypothetical protein JWM43_2072 [Acidobacteriaceae bacterium]|nr:hypothetical protein [Acidobacteriaceae bacterium]
MKMTSVGVGLLIAGMWCGNGSSVSASERADGSSVAVLSAESPVDVASLTSAQASGGLKEALSRGVTTAVAETGKPGGFENNPLIKIAMPDKLKTVEKGLRAVGMGAQVDGFEHSMNAAAEQAAPAAKSIFMDALKAMTFEDAKSIVAGGNTAGTEYFKRTTSGKVSDAFRPIIEKAMANTGVSEKYQSLMGSAPKMPFGKSPSVDINGYVLQKSVDGMFTMMGQEETKIRTNPAAQMSPLLKTVFGKF